LPELKKNVHEVMEKGLIKYRKYKTVKVED